MTTICLASGDDIGCILTPYDNVQVVLVFKWIVGRLQELQRLLVSLNRINMNPKTLSCLVFKKFVNS